MQVKKICRFLFALILLSALCLVSFCYYIFYAKSSKSEIIFIKTGMSLYGIASVLEEEKIIPNRFAFYCAAKVLELTNKKYLLAGEYKFDAGSTGIEVLKILSRGKVVTHKITIPEGELVYNIITSLNQSYGLEGILDRADYIEGEILPETYLYTFGTKAKDLIKKMQQDMNVFLDYAWKSRNSIAKQVLKTKKEALVLASIIEMETKNVEEMKTIAGVYINRIQKNMLLQADPTVIYGITNGAIKFSRRVSFKDLKHKSIYNTYQNLGLPPLPICNPGKDAIIAALNPNDTAALYFVSDGRGKHVFAQSFQEHKKNIKALKK